MSKTPANQVIHTVETESEKLTDVVDEELGAWLEWLPIERTDLADITQDEWAELKKAIVAMVIARDAAQYKKNLQLGVTLGRKDVTTILESLSEPKLSDLWPDNLDSYDDMLKVIEWYKAELKKVIHAVKEEK